MGCGGSSHPKPEVGDDTEKGGQKGGNGASSPPLDAQPRPAKTMGDNIPGGSGSGSSAPSAVGQGKSDGDNAVPSGPAAPPPHEVSQGREKHFPGALFKETRWHGRHYLVAVHGDLQNPLTGLTVTAWCDETGDVATTTLTDDELLVLKCERGKPIDKFAASAFWRGLSLSLSKNDFKFTDEARIEFSLRQSKEPKNATISFELKKQPKDFASVFDLVLLPFTHYYSAHVKKDEACDDEAKQEKEVQITSAECDVIATELDTHMLKGELQDLSAASQERVDSIDFLDDKIGQMIRHLNMLKADGVTDLDVLYRSEKPTNYEEPKKLDMAKWGDWNYDASEMHGTRLAHVAWTLCCHYDLVEYFDIDPEKFGCFWACMQTACGDNPFHNADRALECMLHVHALVDTLGFGKFGNRQTGAVDLAMEDLLALVMCAGIVDVGHTGMDNNYLIESKDLVSNLYNDQHVTEQRRLAMAFEQLENSNCNFLENLDEDQMKDVRDTVCEILFMRANAEMLDIVEKMAQYQERLGLYDYTRKDDVRVVLTMLFRCADIAAWACVHEQHTTRLRKLVDEFYAQGDAEMTRGTRPSSFIPASPWTADRARHPQDFPRGQVHFFDVMVLPLLESIQSMCPSVGALLSYAVENRKFWLSQAEATREAETKDPVDTPFSEALRVRPRLFAISKDRRAFFAALSHCDSGQLVVAAATRHGVYSTRATEEYLKRLGGDAASMTSHVKDQLASPTPLPCEVALKSHDSVASVAYMDFSGKQLELKEDPEVSLAFVRRMCRSFVKLKALQRDKDVDAELEELQTRRTKAKDAQVQQQELLVLHKLCATACEEKHEKQLVEAARLKEELRQRGGHVEEGIVACVRNPLAAPMPLGVTKIPDCRDIDEELFRIIKSQWDPLREGEDNEAAEDGTAEQKFSSVIRPYTKSEFTQVTETLSDTKRQRIWQLVSAVDEWDFDVFALQREMSGGYTHDCLANQPSGGSLFITCYALFYKYGFMRKFNISEKKLINWLSVIEAGYHPNPYHNSMHACDVLQVSHYILLKGKMIGKFHVTDEDVFCTLFASAVHDYNHPGINNSFHVKTQNYLAVMWNDRSVNENIHASSVFEIMRLEQFDILEGFDRETKKTLRKTIVELVLGTDMGLHAQILGKFKKKLETSLNPESRRADMIIALIMVVKMADISNCGRPQNLYHGWCNQIADEFAMQGDRERLLGLAVSPFMDRYTTVISRGQTAFMTYIVVPLFECMAEFLPDMSHATELTESNKYFWLENTYW